MSTALLAFNKRQTIVDLSRVLSFLSRFSVPLCALEVRLDAMSGTLQRRATLVLVSVRSVGSRLGQP